MPHKYTPAEIEYMLDLCRTHSYKVTQMGFNEKFGTDLTVDAIKYMCNTRGVYAFNKKTQRGRTPWTHKEVGSEYIDPDGYIYIKVAEPNRWRLKHHLAWEQHNPPISKDETLFFLDRNRQNCTYENLAKMKKKWIGAFNKFFTSEEIFTQDTFKVACDVCEFYITSKDIKRLQHELHPKRIFTEQHKENIRIAQMKRWSEYGKVNKK